MNMACITLRIKNREHGEECQLKTAPEIRKDIDHKPEK